MTPKEKAKELVTKYEHKLKFQQVYHYVYNFGHCRTCALIAVDEIINTESLENRTCGYVTLTKKHLEYWQEVKTQIEQL